MSDNSKLYKIGICILLWLGALIISCGSGVPKTRLYSLDIEKYQKTSAEDADRPCYTAQLDGFSVQVEMIALSTNHFQLKMGLKNETLPSITYAAAQPRIFYPGAQWEVESIDADGEHKSLNWQCTLSQGESKWFWLGLINPEALVSQYSLRVNLGEVIVQPEGTTIALGEGTIYLE